MAIHNPCKCGAQYQCALTHVAHAHLVFVGQDQEAIGSVVIDVVTKAKCARLRQSDLIGAEGNSSTIYRSNPIHHRTRHIGCYAIAKLSHSTIADKIAHLDQLELASLAHTHVHQQIQNDICNRKSACLHRKRRVYSCVAITWLPKP